MNINDTLLEKVKYCSWEYSCWDDEIGHFLTGKTSLSFIKRQEEAIRISRAILEAHGKAELLGCLEDLAKVETNIRELEPWVRDHVVHALLTYILGIFVNEKFIKQTCADSVNPFQWKLAGLLHDVGYPIEIAQNLMKPFTTKLNDLRRKFGVRESVGFHIMPLRLHALANKKNSLVLIQAQLGKWELSIDVAEEYSRMTKSGKVCHGIISALALLSVIDSMYQCYNPERRYETTVPSGQNLDYNQKYFDEDIVPACSAIFIHNLPSNAFSNTKIECSKAPLPFLLKLCDCLQDWERPSLENHNGLPANLFDIQITEGKILFYAVIPEKDKLKLKRSIYDYLDTECVQII